MSELPEGWEQVTLPEVCDINPPKPPPDALPVNAPVTFVPMPAVDADAGAITAPQTRPFGEVRRGFTAFRKTDVIMAKITPCMENGKAAIVGELQNGLGFGSTEFHVLRSTGAILPEYVYHFIRQESFRNAAESEMTGSVGQKRVPASFLEHAEIPLPPLAEQQRMVAKVEELLVRVKTARARLAHVPALMKRFRQSVLAAACAGKLTKNLGTEEDGEDELPAGWQWVESDSLLPERGIFDGPFGSNLKTSDYTDSGVRVVRLENIGHLRFKQEKETYVSPEKYETLKKHTVGNGDLIFASFIEEEIRACVLPKLKTKAIAKADCFCLRPRQDLVDRTYLSYQLVSRVSYDQLVGDIHGATRPRINVKRLRKLMIRVCPMPEQREIVRRVEGMFGLAAAIEQRVAAATARSDQLTPAILGQAFRGDLVPTEAELACREGRDYEPASVLLERIRTELEKQLKAGAPAALKRRVRSKGEA